MKDKLVVRKIYFYLLLLGAAGVLVLSLMSKPPDVDFGFLFQDKIKHFAAYFLLGGFSILSFLKKGRGVRFFVPVFFFWVLYGGLIEFFQQFTGRSMEMMDLVVDGVGTLAGLGLFALGYGKRLCDDG